MIVRDDDALVIIAARRGYYRASSEPRRMYVFILGIMGIFAGISPSFLHGRSALIFGGLAVVAALLAIILDWRDGYALGRSIFSLLILGVLVIGGGFLPIWLTAHYLPAHPEYYSHIIAFPTPAPR
ncbi:MAG TPA: hypothetical protein VIL85_04625 [Thermomicrobiales bacterium]|jgi:hypothetical protein